MERPRRMNAPHPIQSDSLRAVSYSADTRTLGIWFKGGGGYEYENVPEWLYQELLDAQPHPWSAVWERVKAHPYKRID